MLSPQTSILTGITKNNFLCPKTMFLLFRHFNSKWHRKSQHCHFEDIESGLGESTQIVQILTQNHSNTEEIFLHSKTFSQGVAENLSHLIAFTTSEKDIASIVWNSNIHGIYAETFPKFRNKKTVKSLRGEHILSNSVKTDILIWFLSSFLMMFIWQNDCNSGSLTKDLNKLGSNDLEDEAG